MAVAGKVIQVILGSARLFPDTEAEVPILRWPQGIHDFRFVGMPNCQGIVDDCVGNIFPVAGLGGERSSSSPAIAVRVTCAPPICGSHAAGFACFVGIPHCARALGIIAHANTSAPRAGAHLRILVLMFCPPLAGIAG